MDDATLLVLIKDPTVWLDGGRSCQHQYPTLLPGNAPRQPHIISPIYLQVLKLANFVQITFYKNKNGGTILPTHFWQQNVCQTQNFMF